MWLLAHYKENKMPEKPPQMLNHTTVCEILAISRSTLTRLRKAGALPATYRRGNLLRWSLADLEKFLTTQGETAK